MMYTSKKYLLLAGAVPVGNAMFLDDLIEALKDLPEVIDQVQENVDKLGNTVQDVGEQIEPAVSQLRDNVGDGKLLEAAKGIFNDGTDAVKYGAEQGEEAASMLADFLQQLAEWVDQAEDTVDQVKGVLADVPAQVESVQDEVNKLFDNAIQAARAFFYYFNHLTELIQDNQGAVSAWLQATINQIKALAEHSDEIIAAVQNLDASILTQFVDEAKRVVEDVLDDVNTAVIAAGAEALVNSADVQKVVITCFLEDPMAFGPIEWYRTFDSLGVNQASQVVCLAKAAIKAGNSEYGGDKSCSDLVSLVANSARSDIDAMINCETEYVKPDIKDIAIDAIECSDSVKMFVWECATATLQNPGPEFGVTDWGQKLGDLNITTAGQIQCLAVAYFDYKTRDGNQDKTCGEALTALTDLPEKTLVDIVDINKCPDPICRDSEEEQM